MAGTPHSQILICLRCSIDPTASAIKALRNHPHTSHAKTYRDKTKVLENVYNSVGNDGSNYRNYYVRPLGHYVRATVGIHFPCVLLTAPGRLDVIQGWSRGTRVSCPAASGWYCAYSPAASEAVQALIHGMGWIGAPSRGDPANLKWAAMGRQMVLGGSPTQKAPINSVSNLTVLICCVFLV